MRVLVQAGSAVVGRRTTLPESEVRHLQVRRARENDRVELLDGAGLTGSGRLVRLGAEWLVEVDSAEHRPPHAALILAVAAGDRERFTWMAEKAVELGVTRIVPVETERTAGVATRLKDAHIEKLSRVMLETIKQCGTAWAPEIETLVPLADFIARSAEGSAWLADSSGSPPPATLDAAPLTVLIGPEGGFTDPERAAIRSSGYRAVVLGANTLRFETAAVAAAAVVAAARLRRNHD